jgi:hypothetical protein
MQPIVRLIILLSCLTTIVILSQCGGGSRSSIPPLTITPASLPNGTLGALYSQTIQAGGGVAPFTWAVGAGALPHNLQLGPGTGKTVTISGTPDTAPQAVAFSIKVADSANQSATQSYTVSILAEPDTLSLSPAAGLSFSPQLVGTASTTQSATLTNTGSSPVVINSVSASGTNGTNNGDFSQSNTCGSSLAAGANCTVTGTFTPSQFGPRTGVVTVNDDTAGSPHLLSLSGIGLTSGSNATLSATSLNFGSQGVGTTSSPRIITLSNYGTASLNIAGIAAMTNFGETDTCGASLASAASCPINVTFTPSTTGSETGTLSVTDNSPGSPQVVSLGGTGALGHGSGNCTIKPGPNTLDGYCFHPGNVQFNCTVKSEPTSCTPGAQAIMPTTVVGECVYVKAVHFIDSGRQCP